jgi:hypothetical protein
MFSFVLWVFVGVLAKDIEKLGMDTKEARSLTVAYSRCDITARSEYRRTRRQLICAEDPSLDD